MTSEIGVQGAIGPPGYRGPKGVGGGLGFTGFQGPQGTEGSQGSQGWTGIDIVGTDGPQGWQGDQGFQGDVGVCGPQGRQGASTTGIQGIQGLQAPLSGSGGYTGPIGPQGYQGIQGIQSFGIQGYTGRVTQYIGAQGPQGPQGLQGSQGLLGVSTTGIQGSQGLQGKNLGAPGPIGILGPQGRQGIQGTQGFQGRTGSPYNYSPATEYIFRDDFIGTTINPKLISTTHTLISLETSEMQGVVRVRSGASTGVHGTLILAPTTSRNTVLLSSSPTFAISIRVENTSNVKVLFGLADANDITSVANGIYFLYNSGASSNKWVAYREVANTITGTQTVYAPSTAVFQHLRMTVDAGTAYFYIDGVLVDTVGTLTSAALKPILCVQPKTNARKSVYADYFFLKMTRP